jgi:hypothetical protein
MPHARLLALPLALNVLTSVAPSSRAADKADDATDAADVQRLRDENRALREENDQLRQKINELLSGTTAPDAAEKPRLPPAPAVAKPPAPHKTYTRIEVGMTRPEVNRFIDTHPNLKRVAVSADAGVRRRAAEKPVRRQSKRSAADGDDEPKTIDSSSEHKESTERKSTRGQREVITVAQLSPEEVQTGEPRNTPGGTTPAYATEWKQTGRLKITLIDDVVTAVEGMEHP